MVQRLRCPGGRPSVSSKKGKSFRESWILTNNKATAKKKKRSRLPECNGERWPVPRAVNQRREHTLIGREMGKAALLESLVLRAP